MTRRKQRRERNEAWGRLETAMEPLGGNNGYPTGYEDEL